VIRRLPQTIGAIFFEVMMIEIEKNVPISKQSKPRNARSEESIAMSKMMVGDSFVTSKKMENIHSLSKYANVKVTVRSLENGLRRVWRIA
jgi:hypothetical protein